VEMLCHVVRQQRETALRLRFEGMPRPRVGERPDERGGQTRQ